MPERKNVEELTAKAVSGDRPALQELLLAYTPRISRHIAYRLPASLQGILDVEDVLNATFIRAFRNIGQLKETSEAAFVAWLKAIAVNQLKDALKSLTRKKRGGDFKRVRGAAADQSGSMFDLVEALSDHGDSPSRVVARDEAVGAIRVGIASLPDDQRQAIRLHVLEGRSLAETAAAMQRTPGAVRALIHRGKQQLRDGLGRASVWLSGR